MRIVFVTTQSLLQPTLIGRILPIARKLGRKGNDVTVLIHEEQSPNSPPYEGGVRRGFETRVVGKNPFSRTAAGKKRQSGISLAWTLLKNSISAAIALIRLQPHVIIIVKPLPENVLAVYLARIIIPKTKIVLDVDDFELFANVLSSPIERAALHWSERKGSTISSHIIVATPFLGDHMQAISSKKTVPTLIPTGYSPFEELIPNRAAHTILYIGSISESSGHLISMLPDILREVRTKVPDAKLLIAGAGDDEAMLKKHISEYGLDNAVTWFGRFEDADIPTIISSSTIIIDPIDDSIVNRAKSSFRTMLACAAGMPIITSNIGIRPRIIPEEFHKRFFAQAGDEKSYADAVVYVLQHPLNDEQLSVLRAASERYSNEAISTLYYNCLI